MGAPEPRITNQGPDGPAASRSSSGPSLLSARVTRSATSSCFNERYRGSSRRRSRSPSRLRPSRTSPTGWSRRASAGREPRPLHGDRHGARGPTDLERPTPRPATGTRNYSATSNPMAMASGGRSDRLVRAIPPMWTPLLMPVIWSTPSTEVTVFSPPTVAVSHCCHQVLTASRLSLSPSTAPASTGTTSAGPPRTSTRPDALAGRSPRLAIPRLNGTVGDGPPVVQPVHGLRSGRGVCSTTVLPSCC